VAATLATAAGVAAAFGEGAAEASACGVADAGCGDVGSAADWSAYSVASPSSVVVAEEGMGCGAVLCLIGLVFAETVVDYVVVLVDAALHLTASCEEGESGCGEERGCDLSGALHGE
jgi:hypothetical protein